MQSIIEFILGYIILLIVWLILQLVFFAISYLSKKNISSLLLGFNAVINILIQIVIAIWGFLLYWNALVHKQWLWFITLLIFGSLFIGFYKTIATLLMVPFTLISAYFTDKSEELRNQQSDEYRGEYISPEGKIIGAIISDDLINKKLALFFLLDYFGHLFYIIVHPQQYKMIAWWDYIFTPFFFILQGILMYIIFVLIFNKLKNGKFIYPNWRYVFVQIFKLDFFITLGIQVLAIAIYILFGVQLHLR